MVKKLIMVGVSSLLLIGCSSNLKQNLEKKSIEVGTYEGKYFNVDMGGKKVRIPLLKDYQHITSENDKEIFDILNTLEQAPNSTNLAFLVSNADYMGMLTGIRESIEDSYIIIRMQNNLKDKKITNEDFNHLTFFYERNYERVFNSNYLKDEVNKNANKINSDTKLKYNEDMGLERVKIEPLNFEKNDNKSFMLTNILNFKIKEENFQILNVGGMLHYNNSLLLVIVNTVLKDKLTDSLTEEKEDFCKEYLNSFR